MQGLIDAHEQFKSTLGEADREYQGILTLCTDAANLASQYSLLNENAYTTLQVRARDTSLCEVSRHEMCCCMAVVWPKCLVVASRDLCYLLLWCRSTQGRVENGVDRENRKVNQCLSIFLIILILHGKC